MYLILFALAIGIIAGLRAMTAPAAVSWAAKLGWISLAGTHLAFMASPITAWIFTAFALLELVNDQNPKTPSRTVPPQFIARVVMGSFAGAVIGLATGCPINGGHNCPSGGILIGALAGALGAVIGTLGGAKVRGKLAAAFGKDLPAGLLEDAVAIIGAWLIVTHV